MPSKFAPNLQELEITGGFIEIEGILRNWPKLNKLFLRTNDLVIDRTSDETYCSVEHLTLVTRDCEIRVSTFLSRCQNLRTLELIASSEFYVYSRVLTEMAKLEQVSLGALGGHVPPHTITLLSERCSTTVLLEDAQLATLYQYCPGVRVDSDRWQELNKPVLSAVWFANPFVTVHRKYFSPIMDLTQISDDRPSAFSRDETRKIPNTMRYN
jgi:hypothetical protein